MKQEIQIRALLMDCIMDKGDFKLFNYVFKAGYRMAIEDVLEIKRPKAAPQNKENGK